MSGTTPLLALSSDLVRLADAVAPCLVSVRSHRSISSGFLWRDGLIVTAEEPLAEQGDIAVTLPGGETLAAQIAGRDATTDIALLRIERAALAGLEPAGAPPALGALVLAVGAEDGAATAALGIVARAGGPWQSMRGGEIDARLDLDLRLRRQAEGGVVLSADGAIVGMAVSGARRRTLVIPAATIARVAPLLERHGRIPRGYLGLGMQPVTLADGTGTGVMVMSVDPKGPGAAAGLLQGDVLVAWNGTRFAGIRALVRSLGPDTIGREAVLTVQRGGETREVKLTVGERPGA